MGIPFCCLVKCGVPVVTLLSTECKTPEGGTAILRCTVTSHPPAARVYWYKNNVKIPIDNVKYIGSSLKSPSLVIVDTEKAADQGLYYCEAVNINGTSRSRDILHLHVSPEQIMYDKPDKHDYKEDKDDISNVNLKVRQVHAKLVDDLSGYFSPELQDNTWSRLKNFLEPYVDRVSLHAKGVKDMQTLCRNLLRNGIIDYGKYDRLYEAIHQIDIPTSNLITEATIAIQKLQSKGMPDEASASLSVTLDNNANIAAPEWALHCQKQVADGCNISEERVIFTPGQEASRSYEIRGAKSRLEESSLYVAVKFQHKMTRRGTTLTDSSNHHLPVDSAVINMPHESKGIPHVSISTGKVYVQSGNDVVLKCVICASPGATGVQWKRIVQEKTTDVDIDNNKYIGGSVDTPTLSITNVTSADAGIYICEVQNDNGKAESNKTFLYINKTFGVRSGYDGVPLPWEGKKALTFHIGDVINGIETSDDYHWWKGKIGDSKGWFPQEMVTGNKVLSDDMGYLESNDHLTSYKWFAGHISEAESVSLLEGFPEGTFLVRICKTASCEKKPFLSIVHSSVVEHKPLERDNRNGVYMEEKVVFKCLSDLVAHYLLTKTNNELAVLAKPVKSPELLNRLTKRDLCSVGKSGDVQWFKDLNTSDNKTDIDLQSEIHKTDVLLGACRSGSTSLCLYLLKMFPNLQSRECLLDIAMSGSRRCYQAVEHMVQKNESDEVHITQMTDRDGSNILHLACASGSAELCEYLHNKSPSLLSQKDRRNHLCLQIAALSGSIACFDKIGACVMMSDGDEALHKLLQVRESNVLHLALLSGNEELFCHLRENYPELLPVCLYSIAMAGDVESFDALESRMDSNEFDKMLETFKDDHETSNVLHVACRFGQTQLCMHLCRKYPSYLHQQGQDGRYCLHYVVESGSLECFKAIEKLVGGGDSVEGLHYMQTLPHPRLMSLFQVVCESNKKDIGVYITNNYPELVSHNQSGNHCLISIAKFGPCDWFTQVLQLFLKKKLRNEIPSYIQGITDDEGNDLLHHARMSGEKAIYEYLRDPSLFSETP